MSVSDVLTTQEPLVVGSGLRELPRVNLLPPEIGERRRVRQVQAGLAGAVVASAILVAVLYSAAANDVGAKQEELAQAQQRQTQLRAETASLQSVTGTYAQAQAAQGLLTQAMGEEIRFSQLLNDFSITIPDNTWVTSLSITQAPVEKPIDAVEAAVGTLSASVTGFAHEDVAVWLETFGSSRSFLNPEYSGSTESILGSRVIVSYASTIGLSKAVYSGRYAKPIGT